MSYLLFNNAGILGSVASIDLNSTADQSISINSSKYVIRGILVTNASADMTLSIAAGGVYTAVSKGGVAVVSAAQLYTPLSTSDKYSEITLAGIVGTDVRTETTLYFSLTTAHGSAATADIFIIGDKLD